MTRGWLNWAALATWMVGGVPTLVAIAAGRVPTFAAAAWLGAFLIFGAALIASLWPALIRVRASVPLLVLQTICGLVMEYIGRNGTAGATLVVVAAQLPYFMPVKTAQWWVALQSLALAAMMGASRGWLAALSVGGALGGFQVFALATSCLALRERDARMDLARANAELLSNRALLAESSRVSERLRIARDLHDTLGHHLTALSLQLDVASRQSSGPAAAHVQEAHAIARLLLADVRNVVGQMRGSGQVNLAAALAALAGGPGPLETHLDLPETIELDPAQAQALMRAVQEIVTNTSRHARARHLWIRIELAPDGVHLHARDDGRGAERFEWGHGLTGMRERFEEHAGSLDVIPGAGRRFELRGFLPRAEAVG